MLRRAAVLAAMVLGAAFAAPALAADDAQAYLNVDVAEYVTTAAVDDAFGDSLEARGFDRSQAVIDIPGGCETEGWTWLPNLRACYVRRHDGEVLFQHHRAYQAPGRLPQGGYVTHAIGSNSCIYVVSNAMTINWWPDGSTTNPTIQRYFC